MRAAAVRSRGTTELSGSCGRKCSANSGSRRAGRRAKCCRGEPDEPRNAKPPYGGLRTSRAGFKLRLVTERWAILHGRLRQVKFSAPCDRQSHESMSAETGPVAHKPLSRVQVAQFLPGRSSEGYERWNCVKQPPTGEGSLSTRLGSRTGKGVVVTGNGEAYG